MDILQAIGGLGLFLLGMIVMTDGLKGLAGDAMRMALMRFTRSPLSGAVTGALTTAVLQSSSATTVAAVGFVSAGLLGFSNALGIIFGANIGTTITGWMVALLGFKLKLGLLVMPLILVGAILKLFARRRLAMSGLALAGFGLIFVGIGLMQQGMAAYQGIITPQDLPSGGVGATLLLVGMGIVATLITQSSSAGVAATLTALNAGVIEFQQAAALVIGMDVGTTVTALLASIGGSLGARRTGLSHVIYNLFTAMMAILLIQPYIVAWEEIAAYPVSRNAEVALVAFHSLFNILGVLLILPVTAYFARLIEWLVPDRLTPLTRPLDRSLLAQPALAIAAADKVMRDSFGSILSHVNHLLGSNPQPDTPGLEQIAEALDLVAAFIDDIELRRHQGTQWEALIALNHALDHLRRLHERCEEDHERAKIAREAEELAGEREQIIRINRRILEVLLSKRLAFFAADVEAAHERLKQRAPDYRAAVMERIARGELDVIQGRRHLEAIRWMKRVSHHVAGIARYLAKVESLAGKVRE